MKFLATEICAVIGTLLLAACVLLRTLRVTQNRKMRHRSRELTSRIIDWK